MKGRTGAVLGLLPVSSKKSEVVRQAIDDSFGSVAKNQVLYVFCDNASPKLLADLTGVLPMLKAMALDPVHLPIVYEYSTWHKRTEGSRFLRKIMSKFNKRDKRRTAASWGVFFTGDGGAGLDRAESGMRQKITDRSMSTTVASRIYKKLNGDVPFYTRLDYIECLAALVALYPEEVKRTAPGPNKPVFKILWNAAAVDRVEWMFNNIRIRHSMALSECNLLPSGTSSNEALHAEVNKWFRQTQQIHQSTLKLKLTILSFAKLVSHTCAMYRPTLRQMPSSSVLARSLGKSVWTNKSWRVWCQLLVSGRRITRAHLPIQEVRVTDTTTVKQHWLKKAVSVRSSKQQKPPVLKRKRNAFTRQRKGALISQGKRNTRT